MWGSQGTLGSGNHNKNIVYEKYLFSIKENKSHHHRRREQNGVPCAVQKVHTCNRIKSNDHEMKTNDGVRYESMKI